MSKSGGGKLSADQQAFETLTAEQQNLREQISKLKEQRQLFERLGYSRYYLDMQLHALRSDLAVCEFRLQSLQATAEPSTLPGSEQRAAASRHSELFNRQHWPVVVALVVSVLALFAAVYLVWDRISGEPVVLTLAVANTPGPTATSQVAISTAVVATAASPDLSSTAVSTAAPPAATTAAPSPPPAPTPQATARAFAVTTVDGLNVRAQGSADAPVLEVLSLGTVVEMSNDTVEQGGRTWRRTAGSGWLAADMIRVFPSKAEAESFAAQL